MVIHFNFYGVRVAVTGTSRWQIVLDQLSRDFHYFFVNEKESKPAGIRIAMADLRRGRSIRVRLPYLFKTKMCRVRGWGWTRCCEYNEKLWMIAKNGKNFRRFVVFGESVNSVYEVIYIAMLSAVGEELDVLGYHRIHALGFHFEGEASLLPLKSGGGKSSIAALMLGDSRHQIYSDEIPLVKGRKIYPFPIRIALRPEIAKALGFVGLRSFERILFEKKQLLEIPNSRVARAMDLNRIFFQSPSLFYAKFMLVWNIVLGSGTPQMAEHMLRLPNVPRLMAIAVRRLVVAVGLIRSCNNTNFRWNADPRKLLNALSETKK